MPNMLPTCAHGGATPCPPLDTLPTVGANDVSLLAHCGWCQRVPPIVQHCPPRCLRLPKVVPTCATHCPTLPIDVPSLAKCAAMVCHALPTNVPLLLPMVVPMCATHCPSLGHGVPKKHKLPQLLYFSVQQITK